MSTLETGLKNNKYLLGYVTKPDYLFIYHNRDDWRQEGVWAYIKENNAFKVRKDYYDTGTTIGNACIEIMDKKDRPSLTVTLY